MQRRAYSNKAAKVQDSADSEKSASMEIIIISNLTHESWKEKMAAANSGFAYQESTHTSRKEGGNNKKIAKWGFFRRSHQKNSKNQAKIRLQTQNKEQIERAKRKEKNI